LKYSIFKGCFIPIRQPHIEKVAYNILPELGIELETVTGFTCCPEPMGVGLPDKFTGMVISARNLAIAEEKGNDIITLCNGCTYTLKQSNIQLKQDKELREKVNEVLSETDHEFKGSIKVRHFAKVLGEDVGLEKIRGKVEKPLKGLKIASHTGCHILSPPEIMEFDDPLNPVRLDGMIEALGAEPVDYSYKTQCCGWTLSNFGDRVSANELLGDKLRGMHDAGADGINVICPQCLAQLDTGQMMAERALKLNFKIPSLFYLQYLAIAMGYSLDEIGYRNHRVKDPGFEAKIGDILA
jgi:heterodisulfide reductase subunit B